MTSASKWLKPVLIITFGLALYCVFFSFSRGSWLGELLVVVGLLFLYPRVILGTVIIVLAITLVLGNSILASQISWAMERLNDEDTANGRIIGNTASLRMIEAKPLTGWGWGKYDLYNISFKARVGDIAIDTKGTSHNTYLSIMAELGIPTFLVYMFPVGWWLYLSLKVGRRLPSRTFLGSRLLIMLWLLMLHIFVVTNFMDMIRFHAFGTCIWWMALALIASLIQPYLKPGDIGAPYWATQNAALS
jgi:O-antigen ligase